MGFLDSDLRYPSVQHERAMHKRKRLVQGPNSFFMDVKCPKCATITTVYSHATTVVGCRKCAVPLSKPTGGKAILKEGCSFRRKPDH
jgi:small subunit ribosomal protein S27e